MSCLTRSMQKQLGNYIKRHVSRPWRQKPESVRMELVSRGICPSDVTVDQLEVIMEGLRDS